jgi:hypothetical protein
MGEVAFDAADGLEFGFVFGVFALEVGAGSQGLSLYREKAMIWIGHSTLWGARKPGEVRCQARADAMPLSAVGSNQASSLTP